MARFSVRILLGIFFVQVFTVLTVPGCSTTKTSDRDLTFIEAQEGLHFARGERRGFLGGSNGAIWIDARPAEAYREGHLPGAIHLPLERARAEHETLRRDATLIVYGEDYNSPRAYALSKTLLELGHKDVRTLRGGFRAWQAAGYPVESGE